jgi:hypothetical protein
MVLELQIFSSISCFIYVSFKCIIIVKHISSQKKEMVRLGREGRVLVET